MSAGAGTEHAAVSADRSAAGADNDAVAARHRRLVDTVGPQLGLAGRDVTLAAPADGRRALAFGTRGLTEGRTVYLAPNLGPAGAEVLVHELVHVAQQRARPARPGPRRGPRPPARWLDPEVEARQIATAWRSRGEVWEPVAELRAGALAAERGDVGTVPKPHATETTPVFAVPAGLSEQQAENVGVGLRQAAIGRVVQRRFAQERERILAHLNGLWVDAGDVRNCLQILDTFPFLVARALVDSLPTSCKTDLTAGLDTSHHRSYPAAAVAALSALVPIQLRAIKAANVEGLDIRGFDDVAQRAAWSVLHGLLPSVLLELMRGDRRQFFVALIKGPAPPGSDLAALDELWRTLLADSTDETSLGADGGIKDVIAKVTAKLADPDETSALAAIDLLAALAPTPAPATKDPSAQRTDAAPGDGADTQAAATFDTPNPGERLRYAVGVLEGQGAIARLLGVLSDQQRSSEGSSSSKLLLVLAAREPSRNLALIEKLLSYGLWDWCVRDGEARFAYLLVRSLPLDAQERWKRLDDGKWFQRLEDNIPAEDVLEGRYRGVGKGAGAFDPKTIDKLTTDATAAVKEIDAAVRQGLSGPKAVELFRRLLQLGRTGTTGSRGEGDRQRLLQTAVQRLDTLGHMDRLLAELPDAYLLNEMWRGEVLEVLAVRDPRHLERQARALLSYGIFDWAVTAREAWLAYQLVRSLPAADQTRLEEEDPDRWARIKSNMTSEMRSSHGITAIAAAAGLKARDRIRDKLRDRRLWVSARETELRSLIIQLYALDDRRWVFLQSRDVRADKVKGLGTLVTDLGLFDEITNPHFEPEALRAPQQLAETFGAIGRFLVSTPQIFGLLGDILGALLSPEMRLDDVDLELVQYILGGDIEGAKLAPREGGNSQAKKAVTAAGKTQGTKSKQTKDGKDTERRIDTNKVSIWIRPAEGRLGLELDSLDLASLMHIMPGMSVRTGKATLRGLRIVTDFSDRGYHRPSAASLDAEQIDITDIVLATAETLVAATRLMLQPLHLKAGQRGTEDLTVPPPPKTIPIPVIGPLLNALSHILALTGTIPGLSSIGGALISPLTAGSGFVAEQFSSYVANQVVTPIAEGALGLITDGTFRKPRTVAERAKDAAAMLRSFAIDIGEIDIDGLSFAGQQQVQSVTVKDVFLGVGFSRPTYLRHQIASLDRRLKTAIEVARPDLEAERKRLNDELISLQDAERQLDKLESEHRWNENGLTDEQRRTMVRLSAQLRQSAGATVDVGSVGVGRLSGTVEAAGLDIGAIHAEASAPTRVGDYLPDEQLVERFQREGRGPSITDMARQANVSATVAGVGLRRDPGARPGDPALRVRGSVPSSREVFERLAPMPEGPARTELLRWVGLLRELEALDAVPAEPANSIEMLVAQAETLPEGSAERADLDRWVQWLRDVRAHRATFADAPRRADGRLVGDWRTPAEEARRQELRDQAAHFFGIAVRDVQIGAVHAELVPDRLGVDVVASSLEIEGIESGTDRVARVAGTEVRAGIELAGGEGQLAPDLAGVLDHYGLGGTQPVARFGARTLDVEGVDAAGVELAKLSFTGLSGRVVPEGNTFHIPDLVAESASLSGLNYRSPDRSIFANGTTTTTRIEADIVVGTAVTTAAAPRPRLTRDASAPSRGKVEVAKRKVDTVTIKSLRIAEINADQLGMDVSQPAPGYRVEATSGKLIGFWLRDLVLDMSSKEWSYTGKLGIEQLEQLKFNVLSRALEGGPTTITGQLDSAALPAGLSGTAREQASALGVEFLKGGDRQVDLRGVELSEGAIDTPDGKVRIRKASLNGRLTQEASGRLRFDDLGPIDVDVRSIDWRTAGGSHITAKGSTKLTGIRVKGWWQSESDAKQPDGTIKKGHKELQLDELKVASITSDNLRYEDGLIDLHLGRTPKPAAPGSKPLSVQNIVATKLHWDSVEGVTSGHVDVGRSALDVSGRVAAALHISAGVSADSISLDFFREGRIVARARGLGGDVGIGETEDADQHHLSFGGLDTGVIDIHKDHIDIGPDGSDGLKIDSIIVDKLDWLGPSLGIQIAEGEGDLTLRDITARARIELNPPGDPKGRLKALYLRQLRIEHPSATGIKVILPGTGSITLNKTQPALLGPISLEAPAGAPGFEVKPDKTGKGFDMRGKFLLEGFNLPWVEADITGRLKGNADVRAGNLTIDFLGADGLDLDLRDPRIEAIAAKLGSDKERLFLMNPAAPLGAQEWGISSKGVRFRQRTKESGKEEKQLTVEGAELTGLFYVNDDWGLRLMVFSAAVAGDIDVDLLAGSGTIPDLTIDNAVLDLDFAKLSKGKAGGSTTSMYDILEGWDKLIKALRPFKDVLEHLNGSIDFGVAFEKYLDFYLPIHLAFHDGAINVDKLAEGISSGLPPGVNIEFKVNGDNLELWLNTKALAAGAVAWPVAAPVLIPIELLTSADDVKLLSWTLATGETSRASNAGEVRLWTLVSAAHQADRVWLAQKLADDPLKKPDPPGRLQIFDVQADLSVTNPSSVKIPLDYTTAAGSPITGEVVLAPNGLAHLRAAGGLGRAAPKGGKGRNLPGAIGPISLESLTVESTKIAFGRDNPMTGEESTTVSTGQIQVSELGNAQLSFDGLSPKSFHAVVKKATAKNISWAKTLKKGATK